MPFFNGYQAFLHGLKWYFWLKFQHMFKRVLAKIGKDEQFKDLISGSSVVVLFRVAGMGAGYIFTLLIAREMGAEVTGIYQTVFTVVSLAVTFARLGLGQASVRFIAEARGEKNLAKGQRVYSLASRTVSFTSFLFGGIIFFLSPWLAMKFENPEIENALRAGAVSIPFMTFTSLNADVMRGMRKMTAFAILQNGTLKFLESAVLALVIYLGYTDATTAIWVMVASFGVWALLSFVFRFRYFPMQNRAESDFPLKSLLQVGFPLLLSGAMFMIMSWADVLILSYFRPESEVGVYSIAYKVSILITIPLFAINSMAGPKFSQFKGAGDMKNLLKVAKQSAKLNFITSFPIFVGVMALAGFLMNLFGDEFAGGTSLLYVLALGQLYNASCGSVLNLLNMTGHERKVQRIIVISTLVNLILNILVAGEYGAMGVSITTAISLLLWNTLGMITVKRVYGFWMFPNPFKPVG